MMKGIVLIMALICSQFSKAQTLDTVIVDQMSFSIYQPINGKYLRRICQCYSDETKKHIIHGNYLESSYCEQWLKEYLGDWKTDKSSGEMFDTDETSREYLIARIRKKSDKIWEKTFYNLSGEPLDTIKLIRTEIVDEYIGISEDPDSGTQFHLVNRTHHFEDK